MITVDEALQKILETAIPLDTHKIPINEALNHVVSQDIKADRPIPPFDRAAMDGYAVQSSDFKEPTVKLQVRGTIQTGVASDLVLKSGEAIQIMTGAPCPEGADAIVKVENAKLDGDWVELTETRMIPWKHIARQGEDAEVGKVLIEAGTSLTTAGIAVCASVGAAEVEVFKRPKVKIISTGTEIIPPDQRPQQHQIRDCNSAALRTLSRAMDLSVDFLGIGIDDTEVLSRMIKDGLEADILLLSGGVSMGNYDHVPRLLEANGVKKVFHKVKIKPGKPIWFGTSESNTYVFGLPGNPVSVQTAFRIFVFPLINRISGENRPESFFLFLPLLEDVKSKTPRENFIPARMINQQGQTFLQYVPTQGSGDFSNFQKSHGLIRCPAEIDLLKAGFVVEFLPWSEIW